MLATDAESNRVVVGTREELAIDPRPGARGDPAPPGRAGRPRRACATTRGRCACELAPVGAGDHDELELELAEPAYGVAPGQTACLLDGDLVVGRGDDRLT